MDYCVDYLSFTVPFATIAMHNAHLLGVVADTALASFLGDTINAILDGQDFKPLNGRAPYAASWGREDGGVRIFAAPQIAHVLVECTGTGCKTLRKHNKLEEVLEVVQGRVSRLDLAVDIVTDTAPHQFTANRDVERFKTIDDHRSETGDTYYVGSWKSERFAAVYRYAPPHPRSDTLRVEHRFRRDAAKQAARTILQHGYAATVRACGDIYGWSHPVWIPEQVAPASLKVSRMKHESTKTVNWLYGAVTSAAIKAAKRTDIDLEEWFQHIRDASK